MEENERQLKYYIELLFRYKWTILLSFFIVFGATLVYNFSRALVYSSSCTFMIEMRDVGIGGFEDQFTMMRKFKPDGFFEAIVESRKFRNLVSQELVENDEFSLTPDDALDLVKNNLTLTASKITNMYELEAKTNDADFTFLLASIGTNTFKNRSQQIDQEEAQIVVDFIEDQIKVSQEKLETAEKDLQAFREKTSVVITEDGGLLNKLMELESQLTTVQTEREQAQANLGAYNIRLSKLQGKVAASFINGGSPRVIQLRNELSLLENQKNEALQQYGENHSQVDDLSNQIENKKQQLVSKAIESAEYRQLGVADEKTLSETFEEGKIKEELNLFILENRERFYQRLIVNFKSKHPNLLEHSMEMARLIRAKSVSENLYTFLLQKGEESKIKAATGTGGIKIIDPVVKPTKPIPLNTIRNLLLGAIMGLGLGFGLALWRDYMDNSIRSSEDITTLLGLPIMGMVQEIKSDNGLTGKILKLNGNSKESNESRDRGNMDNSISSKLISHLKIKDPITESYRSLRTNLSFSNLDNPVKSILVTSPSPSEGKSITAANLGVSYAETGKRILILDTDLRKPVQHKLFNIDKKPGLCDFMVDEATLDDIIYEVGVENLNLIPAGKNPPNPAEILASKKFADLLKQLVDKFDLILLDTPPVMNVTDPILVSLNVGGVLFVVKFGSTDKHVAVSALEKLNRGKSNILGVVMNEIRFDRGYGYYRYYDYYSYDYAGNGKKRKRK
jgi:polysaccharide biosynthesis transport protein